MNSEEFEIKITKKLRQLTDAIKYSPDTYGKILEKVLQNTLDDVKKMNNYVDPVTKWLGEE
jgi:hypothetical protein